MRAWLLLGVVGLGGCWQKAEREMEERVEGMEGHLDELFDAAVAVRADDEKAYRQAMKALGKARDLPGVDDGHLEAVRTTAAEAANAPDRAARAENVVVVAGTCASCHTHLGGEAPPLRGVQGDAADLAVAALVWHDEALWGRAAEAAKAEGVEWPPVELPWSQRGPLITRLLTR